MNKAFILFLMLSVSCTQDKQEKENVITLKLKAKADMQEKVNKVIQQLRADCDSSLWQLARQKADSINLSRKNVKRQKAANQRRKFSKKSNF